MRGALPLMMIIMFMHHSVIGLRSFIGCLSLLEGVLISGLDIAAHVCPSASEDSPLFRFSHFIGVFPAFVLQFLFPVLECPRLVGES